MFLAYENGMSGLNITYVYQWFHSREIVFEICSFYRYFEFVSPFGAYDTWILDVQNQYYSVFNDVIDTHYLDIDDQQELRLFY